MNQILVTQKLYMTPELKKKKKLFKIEFFLSVFLVCILSSYYIYAEYNRNESEQVSQQILADVKLDTTTKELNENDIMVIVIDGDESEQIIEPIIEEQPDISKYTTDKGVEYNTEAVITIPKIDISYPVLAETSDELLEVSVNKYWGPEPNEIGNYCIVGHNYKNGKMFGRLSELVNGDSVKLQDLSGRVLTYKVYNKYVVKPTNTKCTSQLTNGKKELTLITCTNYGKDRLIVKCREV